MVAVVVYLVVWATTTMLEFVNILKQDLTTVIRRPIMGVRDPLIRV